MDGLLGAGLGSTPAARHRLTPCSCLPNTCRYLGRFAADLEQAAPSPAAVVARLGSQGALQVFAAAVELCRGWLPDDDEFVGASVIGGQQLLSVAEEDICAAPEVRACLLGVPHFAHLTSRPSPGKPRDQLATAAAACTVPGPSCSLFPAAG